MKIKTGFFLAIFLLLLFGCKEEKSGIVTNDRGEKVAIGFISAHELLNQFPQFKKYYESYQPDSAAVAWLKKWDKDIDILTILGTWCSDSRREVPRFMKIMDQANNPHFSMKYFCVDRSKRDKGGLAASFDIERVPTFILLLRGKEVGRVIERPQESLEADFIGILQEIQN